MTSSGVQDRPVPWRFRLALVALGGAAWLLQLVARDTPALVERLYASGAYPLVRDVTGTFTGWTSVALAELLLLVLGTAVAVVLVRRLRAVRRGARSLRNVLAQWTSGTLAVAGVFVAWGVLGWGLNYQRLPLATVEGLDVSPAGASELARLCRRLAAEAGALREGLPEDVDGVLAVAESPRETLARAPRGFRERVGDYERVVGPGVTRPKALLLPVLPRFGIAGIFAIHTGEATVAADLPPPALQASACHELAHQLGWAREDEADFVGHVACRDHPDADYRYAATQSALRLALGALRRTDRAAAATVVDSVHPGIRRDWQAIAAYWRRHESPLTRAGARVNDAYLKAQGQPDGIRSYGRALALLIGDERRRAR